MGRSKEGGLARGGLPADPNLGAPSGQAGFHRGDQMQAIANQGLSKVRNEEVNELGVRCQNPHLGSPSSGSVLPHILDTQG